MIDANVNFHKKRVITFFYCFFFVFFYDHNFWLNALILCLPTWGQCLPVLLCTCPEILLIGHNNAPSAISLTSSAKLGRLSLLYFTLFYLWVQILQSTALKVYLKQTLWPAVPAIIPKPSLICLCPARAHFTPSPLIPILIHTTGSCH